MKAQKINQKIVANNRKASFQYNILSKIEAGMILQGLEVKALKVQGGNISNSYVYIRDGRVFVTQMQIPAYKNAFLHFRYDEIKDRELLLHKTQIRKLLGKLQEEGITIIPLKVYVNEKGLIKIEIAVCKGKTNYDKRASIKQRDWERDKRNLKILYG